MVTSGWKRLKILSHKAGLKDKTSSNLIINVTLCNSGLQLWITEESKKSLWGNQLNRSQSLFYFVPQDSHNKAGSTRNPRKLLLAFPSCTMYKPPRYVQCTEQCTELKHSCKKVSLGWFSPCSTVND